VNLAAHLCGSAADREILMDASVADVVKDRRSVKELGNHPIKGYDEAISVFAIAFDAPSGAGHAG
jgi:adenylate cyclase